MWDSELFDRRLFDEPETGVSTAVATSSGFLGLDVSASGESDASLVLSMGILGLDISTFGESDASLLLSVGNLTKVRFPSVGAKSLRNMSWGRIP